MSVPRVFVDSDTAATSAGAVRGKTASDGPSGVIDNRLREGRDIEMPSVTDAGADDAAGQKPWVISLPDPTKTWQN